MPLITPPFRTSLLTQNGVPFGTDSGDVQTAKDWWLYWNQIGDQTNVNSKLVTEGTHADRPVPESMPDGALYYESDRGALYAHANGIWQYVAGTMYGTLSPDQRPADLGTHDAGFAFRTIVTPAREFLWSQVAWIEVTALRYGTHAQRLATAVATVWSGMAWMETDRDNVIYQVQNVAGSPAWVYAAGIMADSFSNLPGDLGVNDVNFTFATSDTYEIYRWAGSTWVNQTPANVALFARSTASLTLTPTLTAVPGATLTLTRPGRYLITGFFTFAVSGTDAGVALRGGLTAGGVDQGTLVVVTGPAGSFIAGSQQWSYVASAGAVANLMASKDSGAGGSVAQGGYTTISAIWIGP